jgi:hypothetical protein
VQPDSTGSDYFAEPVRLIEREYDSANKVLQSIVGTSFTIRGWAVTAWAALLGVAANNSSWPYALFALLAVVGFAFVDSYHSWLYGAGLKYLLNVESLLAMYYEALVRAKSDPDVVTDVEAEMRTFKPGFFSYMPHFEWRQIGDVRPRLFLFVFYPALIAIALTVLAVTAAR